MSGWIESTLGPDGWVIGYPIGVLLAGLSVASFRTFRRWINR